MPVKELRSWLQACEGHIYTEDALNTMLRRGNKQANVQKCCAGRTAGHCACHEHVRRTREKLT